MNNLTNLGGFIRRPGLSIRVQHLRHCQVSGLPRPHLNEPPAENQLLLLVDTFFCIAVGAASGIVFGRIASAPITRMAKFAHRIGKGNLKVPVPVHGCREIRELAETFNKMAIDLQPSETMCTKLKVDALYEMCTPLTVLEGNLRAVLEKVVPLNKAEIANLYG